MLLKNDKITISMGGVTFKSHSPNNVSHFRLDPTAVQGWDDGVEVRRDTSVRPTSWGDFSEGGRLSSRLITLSGTAIAQDHIELQEMHDAFTQICVNGEYVEMVYQTAVETRYATVTLGGKPSWVRLIDKAAAWKIDLYAPDPRIYGVERQVQVKDSKSNVGGLDYMLDYPINYHSPSDPQAYAVVANNGNAESWPVFVITGNFISGFNVSDGQGGLVSYGGQVTLSSPVTVDMGKGSVMQDGVDKSDQLYDRNWFSIGPGEIVQPIFNAVQPGLGWCDIIFRDTWI